MPNETLTVSDEDRPESHVFHARFGEWGGWAIVTIVPSLGLLSIVSDWGNGSYRWTAQPSLEAYVKMLLRFNAHYMLGKFQYERKADWEPRVLAQATGSRLRRALKEEGHYTPGRDFEYRCLVDDVAELVSAIEEWGNNADIALARASSDLWHAFPDLYEYVAKEPSARSRFWVQTLIPWLKEHLRTRVL